MCGSADWKIDGVEFSIRIGYRFNEIRVNESVYFVGDIKARPYNDENPDEELVECSRSEMSNILTVFTKRELIDVVLGFIDTGKEAN